MSHKEAEDTQWPRYEVFQQARAGAPYENVGSVHAPDAELALLNARDVFVRRPQTVNLWVVPAEAILMRTRAQLEANPEWKDVVSDADSPQKRYIVFRKTTQRRGMTYVSQTAELVAASAEEALKKAVTGGGEQVTYVWWIVPADAITGNKPEDAAMLFRPAHEKKHRLPGQYHTRTMMREIDQNQQER